MYIGNLFRVLDRKSSDKSGNIRKISNKELLETLKLPPGLVSRIQTNQVTRLYHTNALHD